VKLTDCPGWGDAGKNENAAVGGTPGVETVTLCITGVLEPALLDAVSVTVNVPADP
jgi:hypothetical protein